MSRAGIRPSDGVVRTISRPMVDPRGELRFGGVPLTIRPPSLSGRSILLFDNGQLTQQVSRYGPIFPWLSQRIESEQSARCVTRIRDLLSASRKDLIAIAQDVADSGFHGVILALCNAGVTQPTSILAAELERRGVACVQLCTTQGGPLAEATAARYVPGLPIVTTHLASGPADQLGRAETEAIMDEVIFGLTGDTSVLLERFRERSGNHELAIAADGVLQLPPSEAKLATTGGVTELIIDPSDADLFAALSEAGLSDGLPVIAPTERRVREMLASTDFEPSYALVEELPPSGAAVTVRALAANAVMAGCRTEYFPVIIAAVQAMADPAYRLFQGAITTHPAGNAVVVSGPLAAQLGISSGAGCLGPGHRANATIGRAVNLALMNIAGTRPGTTDLGIFGSAAEFTYCFAESDSRGPWSTLNTELYGPDVTTVTVHKCEGPHNVQDPKLGPEELLRTIAAKASSPGVTVLSTPLRLSCCFIQRRHG